MTTLTIAKALQIEPKLLEKESLRVYMEKEIRQIEGELFSLSTKYGLKDFDQFRKCVLKGRVHERDKDWEDYFKFENLETKRKRLLKILQSI